MATIKIHRAPSFITSLRRVPVFIDQVEVGKISDNETKEFHVNPGPHEIRVELDWLKGKPYQTTIKDENDHRKLILTSAKNPLFAWYHLTLGKDEYLTLKEF